MDHPDLVKLKLSSKIGKKAPVFVAEFSNGRIHDDAKIQFKCFKLEDKGSMVENECASRKLMATNGHLTYVGESNDNSTLRYFVGVRNKNTGKMKLYDSLHFRLKPVITAKDAIANENTNTEKNYWQDRNKLTEEFGGKAQKRILKERLKLNVEAETLDQLLNDDSLVSSSRAPDPFAGSPSNVSYLPPANKNAQSLDQVFDIKDIISPNIDASLLDHTNSWLEKYKKDPNAAKPDLCKFVLQRIEDNLYNPEKLKYLLYYNYLVIFSRLTYADLRKKDPTNLIPQPIKECILKMFTSNTKTLSNRTSRTFPPLQKDRLLSHLVVLALLISDYCVCMSHILMDLKRVTPKHFTNIVQTLGCYITSQKVGEQNDKFVELKLPLNVVLPKYTRRQF